jgi:hypothetical protein
VLPGALPCGVRTFLRLGTFPAARTPPDGPEAAIARLPAALLVKELRVPAMQNSNAQNADDSKFPSFIFHFAFFILH